MPGEPGTVCSLWGANRNDEPCEKPPRMRDSGILTEPYV
jgi:hypothetical protein